MMTNTNATVTVVPPGGSRRISCIDDVPAAMLKITKPPNIARPPETVIKNAWRADARAADRWWLKPMRRNDVTDVNSQNKNNKNRSSAITRPSIAPAKAVSDPAKVPSRGLDASKYPAP